MTLLITGGGGFVLSNLARLWLESDTQARVVVLDAAPLDAIAERFFAPVHDRLDFVQADVCDPAAWQPLADEYRITRIVHGATITPVPYTDANGTRHEPEREAARRILEVNVMGAVNALEFARRLPGLDRFVYVSSGALYADEGPSPLPEDGYVDPRTLYPVSKHAAELITRRYAELFGMPAVSVRFAGVYGPMDRWTPARKYACAPNLIAHLALAGRTIRINARDAVGDWIHAGDVADALVRLLRAPALAHPVYNIAYGEAVSIGELIALAAEAVPGARHEVVAADQADIVEDPARRTARYGAYDISRMAELGWRPRPIRDAMHHYIEWIRKYEEPR